MTATYSYIKNNLLMIVVLFPSFHLMASLPTSLQVIVKWNLAMKFAGIMGFDVGLKWKKCPKLGKKANPHPVTCALTATYQHRLFPSLQVHGEKAFEKAALRLGAVHEAWHCR